MADGGLTAPGGGTTAALVVVDGRDVPLGPLDTALVTAVLAASRAMAHRRSYTVLLRVKAGAVHVDLVRHLREVPYATD